MITKRTNVCGGNQILYYLEEMQRTNITNIANIMEKYKANNMVATFQCMREQVSH